MKAVSQYWMQNYVSNDDGGLCVLCGNSGIVDTTESAVSAQGRKVGGKHFCFCPNGQKLRKLSKPKPAK